MSVISKIGAFGCLFGLLIPLFPIPNGFNIIHMLGFSMFTISLGALLLSKESELRAGK